MVVGHLREQNGIYQIILSWKDINGKRKSKQISTGLPVKGNKKRAEQMLMKARTEFDPESTKNNADMYFGTFLHKWLKDRATLMNPDLYASHAYSIKTSIGVYFDTHPVSLQNLSATDLENFYEHERMENKASTKSLLKLHETVILALSHAVEQGWITDNPAEVENPCVKDSQILFTAFLQNWLKMIKTTVKLTTYSNYAQAINKKIVPCPFKSGF